MNENIKILDKVIPYFSLVHSTPGRLRVRISSKIKELQGDMDLSLIDDAVAKIEGINSVKFNKLNGAVTILYDNEKFPENLWKDLLNGQNLDIISEKIDEIRSRLNAN